jgi:hypothetical protein
VTGRPISRDGPRLLAEVEANEGVDSSLPRPCPGPRSEPAACAGAGAGQDSCDAQLARLRHAPNHRPYPPLPAKQPTHLEQFSRLYGPEPLPSDKPVVLVEENGHSRWRRHRSRSMATIEWLPKYAPGLNDSEAVWSDLRIISPLVHSTAQSNRRWTRSNHERMALPLATHEYLPR